MESKDKIGERDNLKKPDRFDDQRKNDPDCGQDSDGGRGDQKDHDQPLSDILPDRPGRHVSTSLDRTGVPKLIFRGSQES